MAEAELTVDLYSFATPPDRAALAALGGAFDADPALRPDRMDTRDPIRVRIESATAYLTQLAETSPLPRRAAFQRRATPQYVGDAELTVDPRAEDHPRRLWCSVGGAWLERPGNAVAFGELVVRLADAYDAAYGFATDVRMPIQQRRDFLRARATGLPVSSPPTMFSDRFSLRDVYWINVYGPAIVERFGSRLDGLGVRQDRLGNGGMVIWVAESPFLHDEQIASHRDYPWKQAFYEALSPDAYLHPDRQTDGGVPNWDDHRRHASAPRARPAAAAAAAARSPTDPGDNDPEREPAAPVDERLVAIVHALRELGYFADAGLDDRRLAAGLAADHAAAWGAPPDPLSDLVELELAGLDPSRVWWEDTEADVGPGNEAYVELIAGLSRISRGTLSPIRVTERWTRARTVTVRIELPGDEIEIRPRDLDDYMDIETVLAQLNALRPADGGPRFVLYQAFDQTAFVTCVTDPERRRLEERGWSFAQLPDAEGGAPG